MVKLRQWRIWIVFILMFGCLSAVISSDVSAARVVETHQTDHVPWSGYWWPYNGCGLGSGRDYFGRPSPLEKYELYAYGAYPKEISAWYRNNFCQQTYPAWYGHCGHWAFASLWENFEILPSVIDNVVYRVGDKKGLLTLLHTNNVAAWGNGSDPAVFHLWLLKYVKDEKRGFIADMDRGEEVWQYPIYKYTMTSNRNGNIESVHMNVVCADDNVIHDFIGSRPRFYNFYYNLFLNNQGDIIGGEWTGPSLIEHPDRLYATLAQRTNVPGLDAGIVRTIARTKDDALEAGTANVTLSPGFYNLILLDPDNYLLDTDQGSTFVLNIDLIEGGGTHVNAVLMDKNQQVILNQVVTRTKPINTSVASQNPPYLLQIFKENYQTPGIYSILYDTFREYSSTIPYIPKDGNWSGFAITNFSNLALERVELTSYTSEGKPIQTLLGPLTMNPMQKMLFLSDSLPFRERQYQEVDSVRVSSASDSGRLNLISGRNGGVTEITQGRYKGSRLVMPDTVMDLQPNYFMFGRIINESPSAADVTLTMYNAAGTMLRSTEIELDPRESYEFRPGRFPFFNMPNNGWIDIQARDTETRLLGFQHILKNKSVETNFAVPANTANKIVPHLPMAGTWETELVLINTGTQAADMVLHRVMAELDRAGDIRMTVNPKARISIPLHQILETSPASPYYRSIVSISSDQPFSGYYAYKSIHYDDHVTIPLLDENDFAPTLVLTHNTQGPGWGTGVGIFNPGALQVSVAMKPYGPGGGVIPGLTRTLVLDPGEYTVVNVAAMYPGYMSRITFIRFETQRPSDIIGGFHLYYGPGKGMGGANLQPVGQ